MALDMNVDVITSTLSSVSITEVCKAKVRLGTSGVAIGS